MTKINVHRILLAGLTSLACFSLNATAHISGVTGRTSTVGQGCAGGECHSAASTNTTVSIIESVDGKVLTAPNTKVKLTLVIRNAGMKLAGCNIAVKTSKNGLVRGGTLSADSSSSLTLLGSELTHFQPKSFHDGVVTFQFSWQAPNNEGTYYLQAAGNAVNDDGSASGDQWAFLTPVELVVSSANSVSETTSPLSRISPVPAHASVTVEAETVPGTFTNVLVMDRAGSVVYSWTGVSNTEQFVFVWDGRTTQGNQVAQGTYTIAVLNERRTQIGKAVIIY